MKVDSLKRPLRISSKEKNLYIKRLPIYTQTWSISSSKYDCTHYSRVIIPLRYLENGLLHLFESPTNIDLIYFLYLKYPNIHFRTSTVNAGSHMHFLRDMLSFLLVNFRQYFSIQFFWIQLFPRLFVTA